MMKEMLIFFMAIFALMTLNSKNPMKSSFMALIISSLSFLMLMTETGMVWFPLIFFILFTGGILMMFMILSSVLPNEKAMKLKIPKFMLMFLMLFLLTLTMKFSSHSMEAFQLKSMISSSQTMFLMVTLILLYFFNSMSVNKIENYSMRSFQCCSKMIL